MRKRFLLSFVLLLLHAAVAVACQVPVFRYALENWEPDSLTVAIIHSGPPSNELQGLIDRVEQAASDADSPANVRLHQVDVTAEHPDGTAEHELATQWSDNQLPQLIVYFANQGPQPIVAWSAPLNQTTVDQLLASPAREEIVMRLLDGQSGVWVLLKSGNQQADAAAEKTLREQLARQPNQIQLPSLTDLASEEKFDQDLNVELRVEFSLISVEPDDQREGFFREMLLNTESDLQELRHEPIAVPIFGRGRTYFALVGPGITPENIDENCNFICGACSCEVKWQNPGQDLLLAANWRSVEPGNWVNDTPLPELTGIGDFEALAIDEEGTVVDSTISDPEKDALASAASGTADYAAKGDISPSAATSGPDSQLTAEARAEVRTVSIVDNGLGMVVFGWVGVLVCVGLVFTFWRRGREEV